MRERIICWRRSNLCRTCRIEHSRIDDRRRQQRGLFARQVGRRHAEIGARGRLRSPDAVAPLDHVEIDLEDARLGQLRFEAAGNEQLAQLPQRITRRRQIEILRELLRDRARRL